MRKAALKPNEFEQELRALGERYHIYHPFNVKMVEGKCTREQIQGWVANRFYYQVMIPRKDSAILTNCPDREFRRIWIQRIVDHDGNAEQPGGIEAWLRLGEAVGLERSVLENHEKLLPGVKFAVDAYYNFARHAEWHEGVCSSLTELFAPRIHKQRLETWPQHYKWIEPEGLQYFQNRIVQAKKDVEHGLQVTLDYFTTAALQERAIEIVKFKLDVLWSLLDAVDHAYPN
jgi:pyrroloquinoline-quinone synthase